MPDPRQHGKDAGAAVDRHAADRHPATNAGDWLDRLMALQMRQWDAGQLQPAEAYFDVEPLLRLDRGAQFALLEQERALRRARGEEPSFEEFLSRFPKLEAQLRKLFDRPPSGTAVAPALRTPPPTGEATLGQEPTRDTLVDTRDTSASRRSAPGTPPSENKIAPRLLEAAAAAGYEILEEIGRGGMGVVYKARHMALKRIVALKTLVHAIHGDAEMNARFRQEAMAVAKLKHPNIVAVYDVGEFEGSPYLALEFVGGGSLNELLCHGRQAPFSAAKLVEPLARAAHAAHQHGILHRDLKPANVLLALDGVPKISDFGLAKRLDDTTGWTKTGDVIGTPCYMAPEQAEGRIKDLSAATDVYALGVILYELVAGRPPFRGLNSLDTLDMVRTEEAPPLRTVVPGTPRDLDAIAATCLEKNPADRFPSAAALADDLGRFIAGKPVQAKPRGAWSRFARWWRKNRVVAALFLAVLCLIALLLQQLW